MIFLFSLSDSSFFCKSLFFVNLLLFIFFKNFSKFCIFCLEFFRKTFYFFVVIIFSIYKFFRIVFFLIIKFSLLKFFSARKFWSIFRNKNGSLCKKWFAFWYGSILIMLCSGLLLSRIVLAILRALGGWVVQEEGGARVSITRGGIQKILIWIRQWVPPSGILYIWILNDQSPAEICLSQGDLSRRRVETKRNWKQGCGETVMLRTKMAKMRELESYRELNWSVKVSQRMKF